MCDLDELEMKRFAITLLFLTFVMPLHADARDWEDASGNYHFKGEIIAENATMVILEQGNKDLVSIQIDQLSKKDQEYLAERAEKAAENPDMQTWTTRTGLQVRAALVEYGRRDVTIQRRRGKVYVNDKRFDNLPGVYRRLVPGVVSHFEKIELDEKSFPAWAKKLGASKKTYTCEGVVLELENGDLYTVPFFFFSEEDLKLLEPGWNEWVKAKDDKESQEHYSLSMRAQGAGESQSRGGETPSVEASFPAAGLSGGTV